MDPNHATLPGCSLTTVSCLPSVQSCAAQNVPINHNVVVGSDSPENELPVRLERSNQIDHEGESETKSDSSRFVNLAPTCVLFHDSHLNETEIEMGTDCDGNPLCNSKRLDYLRYNSGEEKFFSCTEYHLKRREAGKQFHEISSLPTNMMSTWIITEDLCSRLVRVSGLAIRQGETTAFPEFSNLLLRTSSSQESHVFVKSHALCWSVLLSAKALSSTRTISSPIPRSPNRSDLSRRVLRARLGYRTIFSGRAFGRRSVRDPGFRVAWRLARESCRRRGDLLQQVGSEGLLIVIPWQWQRYFAVVYSLRSEIVVSFQFKFVFRISCPI